MINNKVPSTNLMVNEEGFSDTIDLQISLENVSKTMEAVIDIYSNPFRWITEYVSNAYDATIERALELGEDKKQYLIDNPVVVTTKKTSGGTLEVSIKESSGIGISKERIRDVFSFINKSTKDESEHFIGYKGKGSVQ